MNGEPDLVGTTLGSYRILGELGAGAMGTVYRAQHVVLERDVAVKLLRPELAVHREHIVRFLNEAKAASAIRHPGIVDVLDFGHTDDGRAYFVMEMLDGESLAQRIAARGRLDERDAAKIAHGIAGALTAAHDKGIVHRDLKPDNVFLIGDPDRGERPKLLDFGIAKLGELATGTRYTQTGALMGTPLYMAPEQARAARGIDHRADLYSLGCILYEMLVGQPPFDAVGAGEIIALQLFGNAERPSARGVTVSAELEALVMRLLEKEPQDRPQTAAAVADALAGILGEQTLRAPHGDRNAPDAELAPPPSVATQLDDVPPRRPRMWPWLAGAVLVGAATIGALVTLRGDPEPTSTARQPAESEPSEPAAAAPRAAPARPAPPATAPVAEPTSAVAETAAPSPVEAATPAKVDRPARRRPRRRDPGPKPGRLTHSKRGSPIEIDLD